jgi:hypothetical protein
MIGAVGALRAATEVRMAGDEDPAAVSSSALGAALRLLVSHQHLATAALSRANNFRPWRHPAVPERAGRAAKGRI